ncbi:MAG TPA: hypothetical protein VJO12_12700 [Stellaceae bacterium]|nr:hypothetical protein [Stellaceae bacterium]
MWNEWLARTLRPRPAQTATMKRALAPASVADEKRGIDDVRPSTRELALAAQDEEMRSLASEG